MTRVLYIECGAAETRSAFIIDDVVMRLWFAPARGDETLPRPAEAGDVYLGRVRTISKSLNAAYVDIGEADDAFLQLKKGEKAPVEGARVVVSVKRPALGAKGALLTLRTPSGSPSAEEELAARADSLAAPARLAGGEDATLAAFRSIKPAAVDEIVIDSVEAAGALRTFLAAAGAKAPKLVTAPVSFRDLGVDEAIEVALERFVSLDGGARLTFDETEAMTVVDIDSAGASNANDRINLAAARALFPELSRRGAGGRILVDFLPPSGAKARASLFDFLASAAKGAFPGRAGKLSVDGVFDFNAPREAPTLLERASETVTRKGWIREGRRLSTDWLAKAAIRALENALATRPSARLRLLCGAALGAYLGERPQWRERLAARFGARFDIVDDADLEERSFDVSEIR